MRALFLALPLPSLLAFPLMAGCGSESTPTGAGGVVGQAGGGTGGSGGELAVGGQAGQGGQGGSTDCGELSACVVSGESQCVDLATSFEHCGSCGDGCAESVGLGADSCAAGQCVCAAAGAACPLDEACTSGGCVPHTPDESTWYVDCSVGSDDATGHGVGDALASIGELNARLAAEPLKGGQSVWLARGCTYLGSLELPFDESDAFAEPVVVGAFGDSAAPRPVISGAVPVAGWTLVASPAMNGIPIPYLENSPVYAAQAPGTVSQLFADAGRLPLSAFNDECNSDPAAPGYREMPVAVAWDFSANGSDRLQAVDTFSYPLSFGYSPGEELLIRVNDWYWARKRITAIDAATRWITFAGDIDPILRARSLDVPDQRWGFTPRNALIFVTCADEWAYNTDTGELHLWSAGTDPDLRNIEASVTGPTLRASAIPAAAHLELHDLVLRRSSGHGVQLGGTGSAALDNLLVEDANERGLQVGALAAVSVTNCEVRGANADGMNLGALTAMVTGNTLADNGRPATQAEPGQSLSGLRVAGGESFVVEGNAVTASGYAGIIVGKLDGPGVVRGNLVDGHSLWLNDSAGIYINGMNHADPATVLVEDNLVRGGVPHTRGTQDGNSRKIAAGVYLDWMAKHITVRNNALLGNQAFVGAIFVHGGSNNVIEGNTIYQSAFPDIGFAYDINGDDPMLDNVTTGNIVYTQSAIHTNVRVPSAGYADVMANASGNIFLNPLTPFAVEQFNGATSTFSDSAANTLSDFYVTASSSVAFDNVRREVNATFDPVVVTLTSSYCDADGGIVSGTITLPPLSARLLVRCFCNSDVVCNNAESTASCPGDCP